MTWLFLASAVASGCGAADSAVDPGDLELRDLLGVAPEVAASWDRAARARAREVIARAARWESDDAGERVRLEQGVDPRASIVAGMRIVDEQRAARDRQPVVLGWVLAEDQQLEVVPVAGAAMDTSGHAGPARQSDPADPADPAELVFEGWEQATSAGWADLALRQPELLSALARQAGHGDEPRPLPVIPAPHAPFAMIFVEAGPSSFAAVNPVLLAAQEPPDGDDGGEAVAHAGSSGASASAARRRSRDASRAPRPRDTGIVSSPAIASAANPYSFYGSINECAAFQRQRCEDCTAAGACETVTREGESGLAECQALSAGGDRGHYLFCINLALAIATVSDCTGDAAAQCPQAPGAGNQLSALELNSEFLDDASCATALDGCLADIFGQPDGDFPGPGEPEPPPPPRDTAPSCGDSSANCEFSPSVDASCSTGSCDNSLSCGGCEGGSCQGCESGGCEGCDGCSDGGGGGDGGGSSGCDDGGGDGGCGGSGCEGGCDSGGCEGGGCESGGCEGGGCDSGCEGGGCSGGGGCNSSCSVTRRRGQGQTALAVLWLLAPCAFLEYRRRRERRAHSPGHAPGPSPGDFPGDSPGDSIDEPLDSRPEQGGPH
jgi:hypothetical protein